MAKDVSAKEVIRFMYRESFQEKALIWSLVLMPISTLCIGTGVPFIISDTLAKLAQGTIQNDWQTNILLLLLLGAIGVTANRIGFLLLLTTQARTMERIQNRILDSLLTKGMRFYADNMTGKLVSDTQGLGQAFMQFQDILVINITAFLLTMLAGIAVVAIQSPILGLGLFVMTVIVVSTAIYASRRRAPLRHRRHEAQRQLRGYFADVVINNQAVKIFAQEDLEKRQHAKLNRTLTGYRLHDWRMVSLDGNNRIIVILLLQIAFISLIINRVSANPELLSTGIFAFAFTITLSNRLFEINTMIRGMETAITDAAPMIAVLNEPPELIDRPGATELEVADGAIEFRDVTFGYGDNKENTVLFEHLDLAIRPGEKVGLVGHSGGGKTTITKMLLRFVDIQDGQLLIDGQEISKVTQESLRKAIAYVPQEPMLFHRSLADNIAYGKPGASAEEIQEAARMSHASEFIDKLPGGYDTLVGERGIKLSGGQRQRIAIARAMLKDAPILMLDEATSALDSESELLIQDALWKLMQGRTAIVIAHRLSTIQKMDRIVVLENGRIIEQGSHQELLRTKGRYAELWKHQSGGFIEA